MNINKQDVGKILDQYLYKLFNSLNIDVLMMRSTARLIEDGKFFEIARKPDTKNNIRLELNTLGDEKIVLDKLPQVIYVNMTRSILDFIDEILALKEIIDTNTDINNTEVRKSKIIEISEKRFTVFYKLNTFLSNNKDVFKIVNDYFCIRNSIEHNKSVAVRRYVFKVVKKVFEKDGKEIITNPIINTKPAKIRSYNKEVVKVFEKGKQITLDELDINNYLYSLQSIIIPVHIVNGFWGILDL